MWSMVYDGHDGSGFSGLVEDIELVAGISVDRSQPHIVYTVKTFGQ